MEKNGEKKREKKKDYSGLKISQENLAEKKKGGRKLV